jgi:hypothetical protein
MLFSLSEHLISLRSLGINDEKLIENKQNKNAFISADERTSRLNYNLFSSRVN